MSYPAESDAQLLSPVSVATADGGLLDPSTADASVLVFSRDVPVEVRHSDDQDSAAGTLLTLHVKLLVLYGDDHALPESVRIELSREEDLFFRT